MNDSTALIALTIGSPLILLGVIVMIRPVKKLWRKIRPWMPSAH
jgi:hypothetical protein